MLETLYDFIISIFSYFTSLKYKILNDNNNKDENKDDNIENNKSEVLLNYDEIYSIENPFIA
jgi:hypothetical protein